MDQTAMPTPRRPIPSYLAVVPRDAAPFHPPAPRAIPEPRVQRVADAVDATIVVIERLARAVQDGDHLVARALSGQAVAEARAARCATNLLTPSKNP